MEKTEAVRKALTPEYERAFVQVCGVFRVFESIGNFLGSLTHTPPVTSLSPSARDLGPGSTPAARRWLTKRQWSECDIRVRSSYAVRSRAGTRSLLEGRETKNWRKKEKSIPACVFTLPWSCTM